MDNKDNEYIQKIQERKEVMEESFKLKEQKDNFKILLLFPPLWFYSIPKYVSKSRKYKKKRDEFDILGLELMYYKQLKAMEDRLTESLSRRKKERIALLSADDFLSKIENSKTLWKN